MGASLLSFVEILEFVIYLITNYVRRNRLTKKSSHLVGPIEPSVKPETMSMPAETTTTIPIQMQIPNLSGSIQPTDLTVTVTI